MKQPCLSASFPDAAALCGYPPNTPLLIALSGGADSCLLTHLVAARAQQTGAVVRLAHVHHGIRGAEADADERLCRALAERYGLELSVRHADVPALAKERKHSRETVAREVRYTFFEQLMVEYELPLLLTAHHADDNLETVLFHLSRGSGPRGLCGIAPVRPLRESGLSVGGREALVVRPLLSYTKQDVLEACKSLGLAYVSDATNDDTTYARNRLRAQVVPVLSSLFDQPQLRLVRSCAQLRRDDELICSLAEEWLSRQSDDRALSREALSELHPSVRERVLRAWITRGSGRTPGASQLESAERLCRKDGTSHRLVLSDDYCLVATKHTLVLRPTRRARPHAKPFELAFEPGQTTCSDAGFSVRIEWQKQPKNNQTINVYNPFIRDTLTFDTIIPCQDSERSLFWRNRRAGDVLLWHGSHHSLRKLQNEKGVPPEWRDRLPLLCDDIGIVWAPAIGLRDGVSSSSDPCPSGWHVEVQLLTSDQ